MLTNNYSDRSYFMEHGQLSPGVSSNASSDKSYKYFRRFFKFRQMDFEFAFWQMLYLFVSPQKVYRNFQYRKFTKNQWARDDPAFLVLLSFWLLVSTIGFTVVLDLGISGAIRFLIWIVFFDCIAFGVAIASFMWWLGNKYLMIKSVENPDLEWAYCFDVHLNAFFPFLFILHFLQMFFLNVIIGHIIFTLFVIDLSALVRWNSVKIVSPPQDDEELAIILHTWWISMLFGNLFWLVALGYYWYLTFLGYTNLPFLRRTRLLLYPFTAIALFFFVSVLFRWNLTGMLCYFYRYRAL